MSSATPARTAPPPPRSAARRLGVLAALLLLAGCAGANGLWSQPAPEATPAVAVPADPLAAFAAQAVPGTTSTIRLADGRPANVRLARAYAAASGRECREVVVGGGSAARSQVYCQGDGGTWTQARPLLRGGGLAR